MQLAINQLLDRNPQAIPEQGLIVNAPADHDAIRAYSRKRCAMHHFDHRLYEFFHHAAPQHSSGIEGVSAPTVQNGVLLYWPKSKPFAASILQWLASCIREPVSLWVLAANEAGGKSLSTPLKLYGQCISKTDVARKCTLWHCNLQPSDSFSWAQHLSQFQYQELDFQTYPGVFSNGKLDTGTRILLDHLTLPSAGSLLDLGCGSGVIGLTCKYRQPALEVDMCDVDLMALTSSRLNARELNLPAHIFASDGLAKTSTYDVIVSNPPFHQGKDTDYQFARILLQQAPQHLKKQGTLWIVANRHLAYEKWAREYCKDVTMVTQSEGFKVLKVCY